MKRRSWIRALSLVGGALMLVAACGPTTASTPTVGAAAAKSASDVGGMSQLVSLAKAEGNAVIYTDVHFSPPHFNKSARPVGGYP